MRSLPVVQNWDCHVCGDCCRELEVVATDEEKNRIEALDLANDPEIGPGPWFERKSLVANTWALRHRPDGGCVFLTSANRCRLHERFGPEVKPFGCRYFPFLLIAAGNHYRLGLRFSCPSVVDSKGHSIATQLAAAQVFANGLEKFAGRDGATIEPPPLTAGLKASWSEVIQFTEVLVDILKDRTDRVERRLRKCVALVALCRQADTATFAGGGLQKRLKELRRGLDDAQVPRQASDLAAPGWIGRVLFRTLMATVYSRKDWGRLAGTIKRSRLARALAGWRFIRGRGPVPAFNRLLDGVTFEQVEARTGLFPPEFDEVLERYYLIKLSSLQYCSPSSYAETVWNGVESLALTLPAILWLARAFTSLSPAAALQRAIMLVDEHFGGNPILGFPHTRFYIRTLAEHEELEKLIAWYSR
ncbi:MAG TPA: YkgJ family cysteine cluster protein [Gemmataceae bacterium]|nr:YkgJ family cysteine cluster protein [Gemmataceae bacterium]